MFKFEHLSPGFYLARLFLNVKNAAAGQEWQTWCTLYTLRWNDFEEKIGNVVPKQKVLRP